MTDNDDIYQYIKSMPLTMGRGGGSRGGAEVENATKYHDVIMDDP